MTFGGINHLAVLVAAIASFALGSAWYGIFGRQWLAALGWSEADMHRNFRGRPPLAAMVISFAAQLIMAWMLAGILGHLGPGQITPKNGVISGAAIWFGFVVTTIVTSHSFQKQRPALTLIDGGHWLAVLVLQGAVIGVFG